jgi:nucleoside phosphorylase
MLPSATTSILIHEFGVGRIIFTGIAAGPEMLAGLVEFE